MFRFLLVALVLFGGAFGAALVWESPAGADCDRGSILDPNGCPTPRPNSGGGADPLGLL